MTIKTLKSVFIIAEAGVNHDGDVNVAKHLIDVAANAGADAVKFQTFDVQALVTDNAPKAGYQREAADSTESQAEMLHRLALSHDEFISLKKYCANKGIMFLSTPFEEGSADFLEQLGMEIFKIPSGEITNIPLLRHIAAMGKPMIVSTGMADQDEVATAVEEIQKAGSPPLTLLHCVSAYPADPKDVNLRAMATLAETFEVPVGFSDHTMGTEVALAAVAMGASVIEKHFTLDRSRPGPDHKASMEPEELRALVRGVRIVELALGDGIKIPAASEADVATMARKSLVAAKDIAADAVLERHMIAIRRPGTGLPPSEFEIVIGKRSALAITEGTPITEDMLA
jgi:N,N'-diacetyllegionaminate synthase